METVAAETGAQSRALASIIRGMAVGLAASVLGGGLGFLFTVVTAHLLGQSDFGLLVLGLNLLTTTSVLTLAGADFAAIRFVAAADEPGRKRGALLTPLALVLGLNLAVAGVVLALAGPISGRLLGQPRFAHVLEALCLVLPLTVLAQMLSSGLSGLEQLRGELARKTVEQGGRILFASLAIVAGLGLVGAALGLAVAAAAAAVAVGVLLWRALPRGGRTEPVSPRAVLAFAWPQTVGRASGEVAILANVIVLSHAQGARAVGLYGAAFAIASLPSLVYNSFALRFMPAISRLWAAGAVAELRELLKGVTRWVTILSAPLYAVAIALPGPLLHVFGSRFADAAGALSLLTLAGLYNSLTGPVAGALIMTGRVRLEMAGNVVGAVVVVAASLLLIPRYGLTGAALATISYSFSMNTLKLWFVRRTLGTSTLSGALLGPLAATALAGAGAAALGATTPLGSSLAGGVLLALLLVAAYCVLLLRGIGVSADDRAALTLAIRPRG